MTTNFTYIWSRLTVEFVHRRLNIERLSDPLLNKLRNLAEGGLDVGYRKDARVFDLLEGRVIVHDRGAISVFQRFQSPGRVSDLASSLIAHICSMNDWSTSEPIDAEFDTSIDIPSSDVRGHLQQFINEPKLQDLAATLSADLISGGVTLLLSPSSQHLRPPHITIEPRFFDLDKRFYVVISYALEGVGGHDLKSTAATMERHAKGIADALSID